MKLLNPFYVIVVSGICGGILALNVVAVIIFFEYDWSQYTWLFNILTLFVITILILSVINVFFIFLLVLFTASYRSIIKNIVKSTLIKLREEENRHLIN